MRSTLKRIAAFVLAASAARGPAQDGAGASGPGDFLAEARTADGAVRVLLPSGVVEGAGLRGEDAPLLQSPGDAGAWMRWAAEVFPGRALKAVWDCEPFEMVVSDRTALKYLRKGDAGIDPSRRLRFEVESDPVPGSGKVSLRLVSPPPAREATPEVCATNVLLLPPADLFSRWRKDLSVEKAAELRGAFADLERSGKFGSSPAWREESRAFASLPGMRAAVRFRNGKDSAVRIRIGGKTWDLRADGKPLEWVPDADASPGSVVWEARDLGSGRETDDDWEWRRGERPWTPLGPDVEVELSGELGRLKPLPFLAFPDGSLPESTADAPLSVEALDALARPVPGAAEAVRDGRRGIELPAGSEARTVRVRAAGWDDGEFRPTNGTGPFRRGDRIELSGRRMQPSLPPWKDGAVHIRWNDFAGDLRLRIRVFVDGSPAADSTKAIPRGREQASILISESERLRDTRAEEAEVAVEWFDGERWLGERPLKVRRGEEPEPVEIALRAPAPESPWPDNDRVAAAKYWFSADDTFFHSVLYYLSKNSSMASFRDKLRESKEILFHLLGFRPYPMPGKPEESAIRADHEKTFDEMAAHIAGCPGCLSHTTGSLPPRGEALRILLDGKAEIATLVPWPKGYGDFAKGWWKECDRALAGRYELGFDSGDEFRHAFRRWNGGGKDGKTQFAEAYAHIEVCGGCASCDPFRSAVKEAGTDFEARREALFRATMSYEWGWKDVARPDEREVGRMADAFRKEGKKAK